MIFVFQTLEASKVALGPLRFLPPRRICGSLAVQLVFPARRLADFGALSVLLPPRRVVLPTSSFSHGAVRVLRCQTLLPPQCGTTGLQILASTILAGFPKTLNPKP